MQAARLPRSVTNPVTKKKFILQGGVNHGIVQLCLLHQMSEVWDVVFGGNGEHSESPVGQS